MGTSFKRARDIVLLGSPLQHVAMTCTAGIVAEHLHMVAMPHEWVSLMQVRLIAVHVEKPTALHSSLCMHSRVICALCTAELSESNACCSDAFCSKLGPGYTCM